MGVNLVMRHEGKLLIKNQINVSALVKFRPLFSKTVSYQAWNEFHRVIRIEIEPSGNQRGAFRSE